MTETKVEMKSPRWWLFAVRLMVILAGYGIRCPRISKWLLDYWNEKAFIVLDDEPLCTYGQWKRFVAAERAAGKIGPAK